MKALQNSSREVERLGPIEVLEHKLLLYNIQLTRNASLDKNALKLHVLWALMESVD